MTRGRAFGIALALAATTACAGSPDPVFYALSPRSGTPVGDPSLRIELRRPGIPGYLDRPHIVRRATEERLDLAADERWGAPLETMIGATLVEDLSTRLPGCSVFSEAGALSSPADARVEVEVTRFDLSDDGFAELSAQVAVNWTIPNTTRIARHAFRNQPKSKATGALVASLSNLLGQLSDAIGQTLKLGPPPAPPRSSDAARDSDDATPPPVVPVVPMVPVLPAR